MAISWAGDGSPQDAWGASASTVVGPFIVGDVASGRKRGRP